MSADDRVRPRARGALLGLATGDALGTTLEFKRRGTFEPITDMVGGGPFGLQPGQWTDDTSMALCLAESLIALGASTPRTSCAATSAGSATGVTCLRRAAASTSAAPPRGARALRGDRAQARRPRPSTRPERLAHAPRPRGAVGEPTRRRPRSSARLARHTHAAPQATDACRMFAVHDERGRRREQGRGCSIPALGTRACIPRSRRSHAAPTPAGIRPRSMAPATSCDTSRPRCGRSSTPTVRRGCCSP